MNQWIFKCLTAGLLALRVASAAAEPAALPGDSVYQLQVQLSDQAGQRFAFAQRRGKPQLVSMFYTSCQFVCPRLVDTLRDTLKGVPGSGRDAVEVLLVTIDPARDDQAVLAQTARERHLSAQWTLARSDAEGTRRLAAVLGIQYRQLPSGDFNHSTVVLLLDAEGRVVARSSRLGTPDPELQRKLAELLRR